MTHYLLDQELGSRVIEICEALLQLQTNDAHAIFGALDDLKLRSSMTLFEAVPAAYPIFVRVIDKFYNGQRDARTLELLKQQA